MPLAAANLIRKMRGGAQAWLIQVNTGEFFVVKFLQNAQHRRILINEWLAGSFLAQIGLCAARTALVHCSPEWLETAQRQGLSIEYGTERRIITPGLHFGSKVPVNPDTTAVYDYLPDKILRDVSNLEHFHGVLAFDQWTSNADARQSICFRARLRDFLNEGDIGPQQRAFIAMMIDHGYCFQGPEWRLDDLPRQGVYARPAAYERIKTWDDFEPWLSRILYFPASAIDRALREIPSSWLDAGEEEALELLLTQLLRRCRRVPDLIAACRDARPDYFPNWKRSISVRV